MFTVKACIRFSAAHSIKGHPRCGRIHGHNYKVCLEVYEEHPLDIDLDELERWLRENVFTRFDHQYLNEVLGSKDSVSSEDIAVFVASAFEKYKPGRLVAVEVCETDELCVRYCVKSC